MRFRIAAVAMRGEVSGVLVQDDPAALALEVPRNRGDVRRAIELGTAATGACHNSIVCHGGHAALAFRARFRSFAARFGLPGPPFL